MICRKSKMEKRSLSMELEDPYSNIDVIPLTDYLDIIDLSVVEEEINGTLSTYPFALVRIPVYTL